MAGGGELDVMITAPADCSWTVQSQSEFMSVVGGATGTGDGSVRLAVTPNPGDQRVGAVVIGDTQVSVVQPGASQCSVAASPSAMNISAAGGTSTLSVAAGADCQWIANIDGSFLTIAGELRGTGSATLTVTVAPNAGAARTAKIFIGPAVVTINQEAGAAPTCTYFRAPASFAISGVGGTITVQVNATAGCAWTAKSELPWATIVSGSSGSGSGTVKIALTQNDGLPRSGTILVAGQLVEIFHGSYCAYSATPIPVVPTAGGTYTVSVTTAAMCSWNAHSDSNVLVLGGTTSGTGPGSFTVTIGSNADNSFNRSVSVHIAPGVSVQVLQKPGPRCARFSGNGVQERYFDHNGGSRTVDVNADTLCDWTIATAPFVSALSGSGSGTLHYTVFSNGTGQERKVAFTVGESILHIYQGPVPPANGSYYWYRSDAGDPVAQGNAYVHTTQGSTFEAKIDAQQRVFSLNVINPYDNAWFIGLAAANGQQLTPGTYEGAVDWGIPNNPQNGIVATGLGRGCTNNQGRFVVHEAVYGPGNVVERFRASFERNCLNYSAKTVGEIQYIRGQ